MGGTTLHAFLHGVRIPTRRPRRSVCRCAATGVDGLVLKGSSIEVDGEPALGSRVCGPVLNRFYRDHGEEWIMHVTFRPDTGFDEMVLPGHGTGVVGTAHSSDGISWQVAKSAVKPNSEDWWWFDTTHCSVGDVQLLSSDVIRADGSVYFMYFHGGDQSRQTMEDRTIKGYNTRIGVALSLDGENWSRIEGEHASGAVLEVGEKGRFDAEFVANPQVLKVGGEYRMYYNSRDPSTGRFCLGAATSYTGIEFRRVQKTPLPFSCDGDYCEGGIGSRHVLHLKDGTFAMFFEAISDSGERSIGLATSDNGWKWTADERSPILTKGPAGSWDNAGVSHPRAVIMDDGSVRLYYTGHDEEAGPTGVGLAVSNDWRSFSRYVV